MNIKREQATVLVADQNISALVAGQQVEIPKDAQFTVGAQAGVRTTVWRDGYKQPFSVLTSDLKNRTKQRSS